MSGDGIMDVEVSLGDGPEPEDADAGTLEEWVNIAELRARFDDNTITRHRQKVERLILKFESGKRVGDYAVVTTQYLRKHGVPGRPYARRPSSQFDFITEAKPYAYANEVASSGGGGWIFLDFDIQNCFVTILCNLLADLTGDISEFRTLFDFKEHYKE